ncbi:discoidin domain-containing protein [Neptuniibacter sp. QD37_11]|uniref:discoidin domain-containing protein n=1 Tax=Neptuniibacter sp. QD37_11 TaxID=3398209 RepID=UPI0039F48CF4
MNRFQLIAVGCLVSVNVQADFVYRTPAGMQILSSGKQEDLESSGHYSTCMNVEVGHTCDINNDTVRYAGEYNGSPLYMDVFDHSQYVITGTRGYITGIDSEDGLSNSRGMLDSVLYGLGDDNPVDGDVNNAYLACMNKGSNWFVPSKQELNAAVDSLRAATGSAGMSNEQYHTSNERDGVYQYTANGSSGAYSFNYKTSAMKVRCFAKDQEKHLLTVGPRNNVALLGVNGLTTSSYTASSTYTSDHPAGGFDGGQAHGAYTDYGHVYGVQNRGVWNSAQNQQINAWLQVDFGPNKTVKLAGLNILNQSALDYAVAYRMPKDVTVKVSDDGVNFSDVQSFTNLPQQALNVLNIASPVEARFVRLHVDANYGGDITSIFELEIFE